MSARPTANTEQDSSPLLLVPYIGYERRAEEGTDWQRCRPGSRTFIGHGFAIMSNARHTVKYYVF